MTEKTPYDKDAETYCKQYESLKFEDVHKDILTMLPEKGAKILDVGAGSGRDASWLAKKGYEVTAVEPSLAMIREGKKIHKGEKIKWLCDRMPDLEQVLGDNKKFDFILLSAVWMHVKPEERSKAFKNLNLLLAPNGQMSIVLRFGTPREDMYPVSAEELQKLAKQNKLEVTFVKEKDEQDVLKRSDVHWGRICFKKGNEREEQNKAIAKIMESKQR